MKPAHKRLMQEQLDTTLDRLECMRDVQRPVKGWLRSIREALGMSGKQYARRLGVSAPWVSSLEKKELSGSVTIKTMRQAAESLDCIFVYAIIPKKRLVDIVRRRAEILARKRLRAISHSMMLEAQQLSKSEQKKAFESEVDNLMKEMPKELWEDYNEL
jgi:predicted DNA-binding mobile mystery protein A